MLLGAVYGFVLAWGPIMSLIGIIVGGFVGFLLVYFIREKPRESMDKNSSEIVLMVQ
jgi:uncharacterized membrane protein YdjX (TVP38/TMEM64 family)